MNPDRREQRSPLVTVNEYTYSVVECPENSSFGAKLMSSDDALTNML